MVTPLFATAADLHFDASGSWRHRGIVGDAEFGLSQVVDFCLDSRPGMLLLLGDLFHRPTPQQAAVKAFSDQIERLRDVVDVGYVLGDHDGGQDWPALRGWAEHLDGRTFEVGGHRLVGYGLDYRSRGALQSDLAAVPANVSLLATHQKVDAFVGKGAHMALADDLPAHVRYVLAGDYHEYVWGETDAGQQVWSPGSTHATTVDQDSPRSFIVGSLSGDDLMCERISLRSRRIVRVTLATVEELDQFLVAEMAVIVAEAAFATVPEPVRRPIVDVRYYTDLPHAYERLSAIVDDVHLFLRPVDRAREARRFKAPARPARGMADAVAQLAVPGTPGHDWTMRLLLARDRGAEWRAIAEEVTSGTG
jgi:hypothetical protein